MEPDVTVTMDADKPPADAQKQKAVCFFVLLFCCFVVVVVVVGVFLVFV